ncbi:hypothetical protein KS4_05580 [Poriferisphaera corsica]|uniref:Uncharacterized protein n=1 Tax=Poriferisphaera corsica TaxID=2528020 RepID=A0A517YQM1_9BACT|nr:hypothetical protein KS4_05580 [Poriferisphaera corsica]
MYPKPLLSVNPARFSPRSTSFYPHSPSHQNRLICLPPSSASPSSPNPYNPTFYPSPLTRATTAPSPSILHFFTYLLDISPPHALLQTVHTNEANRVMNANTLTTQNASLKCSCLNENSQPIAAFGQPSIQTNRPNAPAIKHAFSINSWDLIQRPKQPACDTPLNFRHRATSQK